MDPGAVVRAFIEAIERQEVDAAVAMLREDVAYENMPITPIIGRDTVASVLHSFLAPADAVDWQILRQESFGSVVFNERLDRFKIGTGWLELPVAGVFEVDPDGLIARWRDYFDMGTYQRQLAELTGAG